RIGVGAAERLERYGHPLVQPCPRGGKQLAVEGLSHQRVREAEATRRWALLDEARGGSGGESSQRLLGCEAGGLPDQDRVELSADDRRELEELAILGRQRLEPPAPRGTNPLWKRKRLPQHP